MAHSVIARPLISEIKFPPLQATPKITSECPDSRSSWLDIDGRPHIVMMSFGPLSFLGSPRLVHFVDWSSMIANTYTPVLVGEMMFFRTLIVYNIKYSKTVMLITTFFCIVYAIPINVSLFLVRLYETVQYAPLAGYIDIHQLRPLLHDISLVNETMEHVSFGIDFGENGVCSGFLNRSPREREKSLVDNLPLISLPNKPSYRLALIMKRLKLLDYKDQIMEGASWFLSKSLLSLK